MLKVKRAELLRFTSVAVLGLVLDVAVAWTLATWVGVPLTIAAAIGFAIAAVANYVMHELWTFQDGAQQVSVNRALKYGIALAITLAVRLVVIAILEPFAPEGGLANLIVLLLATGVSFVANFVASKLLVFRAVNALEERGG